MPAINSISEMKFYMNRYGLTAIMIVLFFLIGLASGQESQETGGLNKTMNASSAAPSAIDITSVFTVLIFSVTILFIVIFSARSYSNTSKILLEKAFEKNKELPEEMQETVSAIIKAFPQAEPLGLPRGSLRAIIMLIFSLAFVFLLLLPLRQITEMAKTLEIILAILIGFYFGSRLTESRMIKSEQAKKEPRTEEPGVREVHKEITPAVALPEEKHEEKKKRKKREELI